MSQRMKRRALGLLLLLSALLLSACSAGSVRLLSPATEQPDESARLPEAVNESVRRVSEAATLWFRYGEETLLAPEGRTVLRTMNESFELALIRALLAGPDLRSTELRSVFPNGTAVQAVRTTGRTLYVTFSAELLNPYPDEPEDWASDSYWSREVPVRRRLCMQSLAATVTENCDIDRVQVLVQEKDGMTYRLPMAYYPEAAGETLPADPLWRDDSLLLTPGNTAGIILSALQTRDWTRLYRYQCIRAEDGEERLNYEDFVRTMERLPKLVSWTMGSGSVSEGVTRMTYPVDLVVLENGRTEKIDSRILRLFREDSLWRTTTDRLQQLLEVRDE